MIKLKRHCFESTGGLSNLEEIVLRGLNALSVEEDIVLARKSKNQSINARLEQLEREIIQRAKLKGLI